MLRGLVPNKQKTEKSNRVKRRLPIGNISWCRLSAYFLIVLPIVIIMLPNTLSLSTVRTQPCSGGSSLAPWKIFPSDQFESLRQRHGRTKVKLVHFVRHAEGTHNLNCDYKSESSMDARLTPLGWDQCKKLAERRIEAYCIITSPLTRCVQTAVASFPHLSMQDTPKIPIYALEEWRETVNYNCDRRRKIAEVQAEFLQVDFGKIANQEDCIWEEYRNRLGTDWDMHMESAELWRVAQRGRKALQDLQDRPESRIVVCTHSAFLRCILSWGQEGGVPQLVPQQLDERQNPVAEKLFSYAEEQVMTEGPSGIEEAVSFETFMRANFDNCELRSFCLLVHD